MRHLIPTIFYFAYSNAYLNLPRVNNLPFVIEDRFKQPYPVITPSYPSSPPLAGAPYIFSPIEAITRYPQDTPSQGGIYIPNYSPLIHTGPGYLRTNVHQSLPSQKSSSYQRADNFPFDLDDSMNGGSDSTFSDSDLPLIEPRSGVDTTSYYDDLELTENFGNYLKKRTQIDPSSTAIFDAAHQYNALMAVIVALARTIRNSCSEFDQLYNQIYASTIDTYYKYGLANAEKVSDLIEDYIRKGHAHMPKIRKLKQELCNRELFCSASFDNHIKSTPLLYVKELETLEAITHLARKFYPYIDEFNQAAISGNVLPYLKKSKERLKEYILQVINSVEHLTDRPVKCIK